MRSQKPLGGQSTPLFQHASVEEYAAFVQAYTPRQSCRNHLLRFRKQFVRCYPQLLDWFQAPLPERIGRLYGEKWNTRHNQVSFHARPYLTFLALRGYAPLDWDWLLAVHDLHVDVFLQQEQFTSHLSSLIEEAISLGYAPNMVRSELQWAVHRIFLHVGTTQIEDITALHLVEFTEALERFGHRPDLALFYGSSEPYLNMLKKHHIPALHPTRKQFCIIEVRWISSHLDQKNQSMYVVLSGRVWRR